LLTQLPTSTKRVRASLIVLNFNGAEVLGPCIDSLRRALGDNDEIIIVDNASTDGSEQLVMPDEHVKVLRLPTNTFIFGLNEGLAIANGNYVAFLNNDIVVEPGFVEACLERFSDTEDVFAVCARVLDGNGDEQGSRTRGFWKGGLFFYQSLQHSESPTDCFFAVGGQSFFDRERLIELGSIDPLLHPMYHEDIELSYRAWKRGWRIRYAPTAIAHHVGSHSSKRVFTPMQLRSFVRQNEYLIVWKNVTDIRLLLEHFLLVLPRLLCAVAARDWATVVGFGRALRRVRSVHAARSRARYHMKRTDAAVIAEVSSIS